MYLVLQKYDLVKEERKEISIHYTPHSGKYFLNKLKISNIESANVDLNVNKVTSDMHKNELLKYTSTQRKINKN